MRRLGVTVAVLLLATLLGGTEGLRYLTEDLEYVFNSPQYRSMQKEFDVTGEIAVASPDSHGCSVEDMEEGKVMLVEVSVCSSEDKALACLNSGCLGVIVHSGWSTAGLDALIYDGQHSSSLLRQVPMVEVSPVDGDRMKLILEREETAGNTVRVNIYSGDNNPWSDMFDSAVFLVLTRILQPVVGIITLGIAFWRLSLFIIFWRQTKTVAWLPVVCLSIEALSNTLRLFHWIVDPFFANSFLPYLYGRILLTITMPWAYATTVLVAFFWKEALDTTSTRSITFLRKLKIPFFIIVIMLLTLDLSTSILAGLYVDHAAINSIAGAVTSLCLIGVAIPFIVIGRRVLKNLGDRHPNLRKMTIRLIVSAVGMFISILGAFLIATAFFTTPWGYWLSLWLVSVGIMITSLAQILAFGRPFKRSKGSSRNSSGGSRASRSETLTTNTERMKKHERQSSQILLGDLPDSSVPESV